ncbi:MAG TPA: SDR family oxidoreductase, partial [Novosphingobium sp.]|nr:SDR family oxidoreductase [Novosphingobium sp.]
NAGGAHRHIGLSKMTVEGWDRDIALNLSSAQYCSQAAFPHLRESRGNIVNISSMAGINGTNGVGAYSAAKAGLQMLTRVMASEWGAHGIRVNCVAPGMTATEKAVEGWEKIGFDAATIAKSAFALGRYGEAREVAQMAVFFASPAASYIAGQTVEVSGGPKLGGMVEVD